MCLNLTCTLVHINNTNDGGGRGYNSLQPIRKPAQFCDESNNKGGSGCIRGCGCGNNNGNLDRHASGDYQASHASGQHHRDKADSSIGDRPTLHSNNILPTEATKRSNQVLMSETTIPSKSAYQQSNAEQGTSPDKAKLASVKATIGSSFVTSSMKREIRIDKAKRGV